MVTQEEKGWTKRVEELNKKGLLTREQEETLTKMVLSPDKENYVLAQEILKCKMNEEIIKGLNEGQTIAFAGIVEFFNDPQANAFVLKGFAGTGKTFLVKRVLESIVTSFPNRRIAITAPTNKAVSVLQKKAPFSSKATEKLVFTDLFDAKSKLEYMTIHKLLGLKEEITAAGQQVFKPAGKEKNELSKFHYLIVDEVSMLDDELCHMIMKHSDKVRILFMGDPAQIPPINKEYSIPFSENPEYTFEYAELTEPMRQKEGNPILENAFIIRDNLSVLHPIPKLETKVNAEGKGVFFYHAVTDRPKMRPLFKEYFDSQAFKEDADYVKVICWRNKTVDYINNIIRELMYGKDAQPFVVGEKLIAHKPIFEKISGARYGNFWTIQFNTSEEMEVIAMTTMTRRRTDGIFKLSYKIYLLKVKAYNPDTQKYFTSDIEIVHPDSFQEYEALCKLAKEKAINSRLPKDWVVYYDMLKWSANVAYNYAITAHKSQGSTYTNVILMEEDIDANNRIVERNHIKYTASSRATDKLFILRKNYDEVH